MAPVELHGASVYGAVLIQQATAAAARTYLGVGPAAAGLPTGGTVGQYLRKSSSTDYDAAWATTLPAAQVAAGTFAAGDFTFPAALTITGALTANGNVLLGNATGDTTTISGTLWSQYRTNYFLPGNSDPRSGANSWGVAIPGIANALVAFGTTSVERGMMFVHAEAAAEGPLLFLGKTRGSNPGVLSALSTNDNLGTISMRGAATSSVALEGFRLNARVNGAISASSLPTDVYFATHNGSSLADRWVWRAAGNYEPVTHNVYDIGATAVRVRTGYFGTSVVAPTGTFTNVAGTLTTATQNSVTTMTALTTIGTLVAGAVPASLVTAGTFGAGAYTFPADAVSVTFGGGTNVAVYLAFAGTRAYTGYDGVDAVLRGGSTKGAKLVVNDVTAALSIDSAAAATFSSTLVVTGTLTLSSATAVVFGGAGDITMRANTADAADTARLLIAGGGSVSSSRGAYIVVGGNENASTPGQLILVAGSTGAVYVNSTAMMPTSSGLDLGSSALRWDAFLSIVDVNVDTTTQAVGITNASNTANGEILLATRTSDNDYQGGSWVGRRSRTTGGAVNNNDVLAGIFGQGHDGTSFYGVNVAAIRLLAAETHTTGPARGTKIDFATTAIGGATRVVRGTITDAGVLSWVGAATFGGTVGITGVASFASGTAAAPSITFAADGGLNTGFYWSAENVLGVTTGGTARLTISTTTAEFAIPVTYAGSSATPLILSRTSTGANVSTEYRTTSGSVYVGHGAAGTFAVRDNADLSTSPWMSLTSTTFTHNGSAINVLQGGATGTMVVGANASTVTNLIINRAAGSEGALQFSTASSRRWRFIVSTTAESGGNAGSNLNLVAYDDAAASIDSVFSIVRAAGGAIAFAAARPITGGTYNAQTISSAASFTGTLAVTGLLTSNNNILFPSVGSAIGAGTRAIGPDNSSAGITANSPPGGGFIVKVNAVAAATFLGASATLAGTLELPSTLIFTNSGTIRTTSTDGADNLQITITPASAGSNTRGALSIHYGNEHASFPGRYYTTSGNAASADWVALIKGTEFLGVTRPVSTNIIAFTGQVTISDTLTQSGASASLAQTTSAAIVYVGTGTAGASSTLHIRSAVGQTAGMYLTSAGTARWILYKDGSGGEPGADAGSPFRINAYTDAGVFIDSVLSITRAAGGDIAWSGARRITAGRLALTSTTAFQLAVGYDGSNYFTTDVSSAGAVTFNAIGASAGFTFSDPVTAALMTASTSITSPLLTATAAMVVGPSNSNTLILRTNGTTRVTIAAATGNITVTGNITGAGLAELRNLSDNSSIILGAGSGGGAVTDMSHIRVYGYGHATLPGQIELRAINTAGSFEATTIVVDPVVGGMVISEGVAGSGTALLTLTSTTKGLLLPRMTTTQRDAIGSPPSGLLIYNSTTGKLNVRGASAWEAVTSA